jgi:hypothetical protein
VTFDEMEGTPRERLKALPPTAGADLFHVLRLRTSDWPTGSRVLRPPGHTRTFGELRIDLEQDLLTRR